MKEFLANLFKPFTTLIGWIGQFILATFQSILKFKMAVRVAALVLAAGIWYDNNKKFEQAKQFYAFSVQQGLQSENPQIRAKARKEYRKLQKEEATT